MSPKPAKPARSRIEALALAWAKARARRIEVGMRHDWDEFVTARGVEMGACEKLFTECVRELGRSSRPGGGKRAKGKGS